MQTIKARQRREDIIGFIAVTIGAIIGICFSTHILIMYIGFIFAWTIVILFSKVKAMQETIICLINEIEKLKNKE
jgi:hypothetical protein